MKKKVEKKIGSSYRCRNLRISFMMFLGDENASGASCNTFCVRDNGFCQSARLLQAGLHVGIPTSIL